MPDLMRRVQLDCIDRRELLQKKGGPGLLRARNRLENRETRS